MARFNQKCRDLHLLDCRLVYQPAQSPDFNICDLCFFPSIESLYYQIPGEKDMAAIIASVRQAFEDYDPNLLNRAFLSLFLNYNMCLKHNGCNKYKVPHMGKERLERNGELPHTIKVWSPLDDVDVPEEIVNADNNHADEEGSHVDLFEFTSDDEGVENNEEDDAEDEEGEN
jgi:hypothetical protein